MSANINVTDAVVMPSIPVYAMLYVTCVHIDIQCQSTLYTAVYVNVNVTDAVVMPSIPVYAMLYVTCVHTDIQCQSTLYTAVYVSYHTQQCLCRTAKHWH